MNALYSVGYNLTLKGSILLLNYIVLQILAIEAYGKFALFFSTVSSFVVISSLGLLYSGNIITSKWFRKNKIYVFNYFKFSVYLIFFISLILSLIYSFFYNNFIYVFFAVFLFSLASAFDGFFYGLLKIKRLFFLGIFNFLISLIASYFLVFFYDLKGALISVIVLKLILVIFQFFYFFKEFKGIDLSWKVDSLKKIILYYKKNNMPLFFSSLIATPVITILMYILSLKSGYQEVAIFSWNYQIYLIGMFLPMALNTFFLSKLNNKNILDRKNYLIKKIIRINLFFSLFFSLFLFFLKDIILQYSGIDTYSNSSNIFITFLICMILYSINLSFFNYWSSIGKSSFHLKMQIIWSAVVLLFSISLVNFIGALSIPISMLIGFIFQLYFQVKAIRK